MPPVYFVLGLPGSGRREVLLDLIDGGLPDAKTVAVFHAPEVDPSTEAAVALAAHPGVTFIPYTFTPGVRVVAPPGFTVPLGTYTEGSFHAAPDAGADADAVFFLADALSSPIDQLEAFPTWLREHGWELTRVLLLVHCSLAADQPFVARWYEACAHFADCVLLNRRTPAAHVWMQDFRKLLGARHYPCHIALVKDGGVENAPLLLFPETRRASHAFDHVDPYEDLEDEDEEDLPEGPFALEQKVDPYFERLPSGHRKQPVPDLMKILAESAQLNAKGK